MIVVAIVSAITTTLIILITYLTNTLYQQWQVRQIRINNENEEKKQLEEQIKTILASLGLLNPRQNINERLAPLIDLLNRPRGVNQLAALPDQIIRPA